MDSWATFTWGALLAGVASWSLAEYVIHRGLGHVFVRTRNPFTVEHRKHHATTAYFSPSWKKAIAAAGTLVVVAPIAIAVVGPVPGTAFTAGVVAMYVVYEVVHRRAHTHGPRGWYGRWVRRHHFTHHFVAPKRNHGVTSPVWDLVFGTHEPAAVVRVPARHAMPWLLDPVTGAVRAELVADYVLQARAEDPPPG
jgi:sterol desaturase/sphingolipid hydroxylase (fatty acid hydroxylase superfamily)